MTQIRDKSGRRESLMTANPLHQEAAVIDFSSDPASSADTHAGRLQQLEAENRRLLILVAELLIKNQQLRKACDCDSSIR